MPGHRRGDDFAVLLLILSLLALAWAVANLSVRVSEIEITLRRIESVPPLSLVEWLDFLCPDCLEHPAMLYGWFSRGKDYWLCLRCGNAFPEDSAWQPLANRQSPQQVPSGRKSPSLPQSSPRA